MSWTSSLCARRFWRLCKQRAMDYPRRCRGLREETRLRWRCGRCNESKNTPRRFRLELLAKMKPAAAISSFLAERIAAGDFPSAVYLVAERGREIFADALGNSVVEPHRIAATIDTIYDLASLTKPLITGLLCARRIESGEVTLDSSVSHYLPEFDRTDKQSITVRHLLTHSSGLPAWRPLYILANGDGDRTLAELANP